MHIVARVDTAGADRGSVRLDDWRRGATVWMEVNVKAPQAVPIVTDTRAAQPIFYSVIVVSQWLRHKPAGADQCSRKQTTSNLRVNSTD